MGLFGWIYGWLDWWVAYDELQDGGLRGEGRKRKRKGKKYGNGHLSYFSYACTQESSKKHKGTYPFSFWFSNYFVTS